MYTATVKNHPTPWTVKMRNQQNPKNRNFVTPKFRKKNDDGVENLTELTIKRANKKAKKEDAQA